MPSRARHRALECPGLNLQSCLTPALEPEDDDARLGSASGAGPANAPWKNVKGAAAFATTNSPGELANATGKLGAPGMNFSFVLASYLAARLGSPAWARALMRSPRPLQFAAELPASYSAQVPWAPIVLPSLMPRVSS